MSRRFVFGCNEGLPVSTEAEVFLKKALFGSHKTLTTIIYIEATYDAPQWTKATNEKKDVLEETNAHQRAASRNSVALCHHCARLPLLAR